MVLDYDITSYEQFFIPFEQLHLFVEVAHRLTV